MNINRIISLEGYSNNVVVLITNNSIGIIKNNCPDKLCIKQGFIKNSYECIICVPNKILIEIKDEKEKKDIDAITE